MQHDDRTLARLTELAGRSLGCWHLDPAAEVSLMNVSENATFRVDEPDGGCAVLRVHRAGYHSRRGIESELAWLDALAADAGIVTPHARTGRDGRRVQEGGVEGLDQARHMVLFDFIEGEEPDAGRDLVEPFRMLGRINARLHRHAETWSRPGWFERLTWDDAHVFGLGVAPNWGDWRAGPGIGKAERAVLEPLEEAVVARLARYGRDPSRYGLAHCDLRIANLLVDGAAEPRVIDFDDCGFGWFLYDLAAALTVIDHLPNVEDWIAAWLEGYEEARPLSAEDVAEIPTFLMLRRMAILAWMGTHPETELTAEHGARYAGFACDRAEDYLDRLG